AAEVKDAGAALPDGEGVGAVEGEGAAREVVSPGAGVGGEGAGGIVDAEHRPGVDHEVAGRLIEGAGATGIRGRVVAGVGRPVVVPADVQRIDGGDGRGGDGGGGAAGDVGAVGHAGWAGGRPVAAAVPVPAAGEDEVAGANHCR